VVIPPDDCGALVEALRSLLTDDSLREEMARQSVEIISRWTYREYIASFKEAVGLVTA
jgi:hypothetical protein